MKFGVKTYGDIEFIRYFEDKADFLELMATPKDISSLKDYSLPIVLHAMHSYFGVNLADKMQEKKNLEAIDLAIKMANKLNSKKIILHPGDLVNEKCSVENAINLIKDLDDRFILENCAGKNSLASTPGQMKKFSSELSKGICLDFNHAMLLANSSKVDYKSFITDFISLSPRHFHLCGYKKGSFQDEHLSFEHSDYDYREFLKIIPSRSEVTLETSTNIKNVEKDLEHVREYPEEQT